MIDTKLVYIFPILDWYFCNTNYPDTLKSDPLCRITRRLLNILTLTRQKYNSYNQIFFTVVSVKARNVTKILFHNPDNHPFTVLIIRRTIVLPTCTPHIRSAPQSRIVALDHNMALPRARGLHKAQ